MSWNDPVADLPFISAIWADAQDMDTETLSRVLDSANSLCVAYAPALPADGVVPEAWRLAEIFQARHLWASFQGGNAQAFGADGYEISSSTWTLVLQARDLLRPKASPFGRVI